LIFGSFEILGKPGFSQFPGFLPGKTDHETSPLISDQAMQDASTQSDR
jgi:hypothetical protein